MGRPFKKDAIDARARLGLRITPDLRKSLEELAERNDRELAAEVRAALEAHVRRWRGFGGPK